MSEGMMTRIPLADLPPGPELAGRLAEFSLADASEADLIDALAARERVKAEADAGQLELMKEIAARNNVAANPETDDIEPDEFCADHVGCALTLPRQTAKKRLLLALAISQRLPRVLDALKAGRINLYKASIIHAMTEHLEPADAAKVAGEVLTKAPTQTGAQVRNRARQLAFRTKPKESAKAAKRNAEAARDLALREGVEGNGELLAIMGAGDAVAIWQIVNAAAYQVKKAAGPDDKRTIGQIRIEVLRDLILGRRRARNLRRLAEAETTRETTDTDPNEPDTTGAGETSAGETEPARAAHAEVRQDEPRVRRDGPEGESTSNAEDSDDEHDGNDKTSPRTVVNVSIPLSEFLKLFYSTRTDPDDPDAGNEHPSHLTRDTLTRLGEAPGHIDRLGYIAGWVIRDLVHNAAGREGTAFRGIIFDDTTGTFIAATTPNYRLPTWLNQHIKHRDTTCRFPGCRRSAELCDVDHVKAWHKGDTTQEFNLEYLCRTHHRLKQHPAWRVHYEGGTAIWTAPTGHTYVSEPHDYRDSHPFSDPDADPPDEPIDIEEYGYGYGYEEPPDDDRENSRTTDHEHPNAVGGEPPAPGGGWRMRCGKHHPIRNTPILSSFSLSNDNQTPAVGACRAMNEYWSWAASRADPRSALGQTQHR